MAMPGENGQLVSPVIRPGDSGAVTCGLAKKSDTEVISFLSVFLAIVGRSPHWASYQLGLQNPRDVGPERLTGHPAT